jgi:hypothetical protein
MSARPKMKKLMVYLDDDFHADLKELAHLKKTTMAALIRYAVDKTFEDELDDLSSARALEEMLSNPEETMSLEEYLERRGLALPNQPFTESPSRPSKVAERGGEYRV